MCRLLRGLLLQCRNATEDVAQEAKLLERKLLLCQCVLLRDVQTLLCLLLLQATNAKQLIDILAGHLLALRAELCIPPASVCPSPPVSCA